MDSDPVVLVTVEFQGRTLTIPKEVWDRRLGIMLAQNEPLEPSIQLNEGYPDIEYWVGDGLLLVLGPEEPQINPTSILAESRAELLA